MCIRDSFKHLGDSPGVWLTWVTITDSYCLAWDNFKAARGWLVEFEYLQQRYPGIPVPDLEARVVCGVFNMMLYAWPEHPRFAYWEQRLVQLLQSRCPPEIYLISLVSLLLHYVWNTGQRAKATWALTLLRNANAETSDAVSYTHLDVYKRQLGDGPPLPLLTPESQQDIPAFTRRYIRLLCQRLNPPFILLQMCIRDSLTPIDSVILKPLASKLFTAHSFDQ